MHERRGIGLKRPQIQAGLACDVGDKVHRRKSRASIATGRAALRVLPNRMVMRDRGWFLAVRATQAVTAHAWRENPILLHLVEQCLVADL